MIPAKLIRPSRYWKLIYTVYGISPQTVMQKHNMLPSLPRVRDLKWQVPVGDGHNTNVRAAIERQIQEPL